MQIIWYVKKKHIYHIHEIFFLLSIITNNSDLVTNDIGTILFFKWETWTEDFALPEVKVTGKVHVLKDAHISRRAKTQISASMILYISAAIYF